ncbi:hypothetical protein BU17DRAFT_72050 [Hysterangium stoloniferum]|nr:hypothetical protein BU17DRAFT_72050 [Hysterangium stoloniferum]
MIPDRQWTEGSFRRRRAYHPPESWCGRHGTKLNSPRLSMTIRPYFFLAENSDSDESPAFNQTQERPFSNTPRLVRNRPQLPWASFAERISQYQGPLMVLTDFDFDVEIADRGEICTALEMMKPMCTASPPMPVSHMTGRPKRECNGYINLIE